MISPEEREKIKKSLKEQVSPLLLSQDEPLYLIDFKTGTKERIN